MTQKIAVVGKGYLGSSIEEDGHNNVTVFGKDKLTFSKDNPHMLFSTLSDYDVVINCIAKSNTRFCEDNYEDAFYSNVEVPTLLAEWCEEHDKKFVHVSTGCLYDVPYAPQNENSPLVAHCNYTLTKWQAEKQLEKFPNTLIVRPRLLFDDRSWDMNLLCKLVKFNKLCNNLDSITSLNVLKNAIFILLENECTGVFNVACDGYTSMLEIGKTLGLDKDETSIEEIRLQQGLHLVNNVMDISKLKQYYKPPHILDEVRSCYNRLNNIW
jgi:dTDP-4-dehydrorhamnose reductase